MLMSKLIPRIWDFCAEAASHIYQTGGYRLVITRVGRIGAGETIEWCKIIQQKLKNQKKIEKKNEGVQIMSGKGSPADIFNRLLWFVVVQIIFLASLTSLEPDVTIRVIPEPARNTTNSSRNGVNNETLRPDSTTSHLAVFATSSTIRKQTTTNHNDTQMDIMDFGGNVDGNVDGEFFMDATQWIIQIFILEDDQDIIDGMLEDGIAENDSSDGNDLLSIELSHQPLAVAIWISTSVIPSGLPTWFGPVNRNQPTSIRVALHINQPSKVTLNQLNETKLIKIKFSAKAVTIIR